MKLRDYKLPIIILALILTITSLPSGKLSYASTLSDIKSHWAESFILSVAGHNVISGYPDGTFKPNKTINRDEFIRMVIGSLDEKVRPTNKNEYWAMPYLEKALELKIFSTDYFGEITSENFVVPISREEMASILVKAYRLNYPAPTNVEIEQASKQLSDFNTVNTLFLDDVISSVALGYITGTPQKTFAPKNQASRAEAAKVLYVHLEKTGKLETETEPEEPITKGFQIRGVPIGASESTLIKTLGTPVRKDVNAYGFSWWIYHNQYSDYSAIGLYNGKVVGFYTLSNQFTSDDLLTLGMTKSQVNEKLGMPITSILKGNVRYKQDNSPYVATYENDSYFIKAHFDAHLGGKLYGVQILTKEAERLLKGFYGTSSLLLKSAYEQQIFDLANAFRVQNNLTPFVFSKDAATVAYKRSEDMALNNYFDHVSPTGTTAAHVFKSIGLTPSLVSENISAGYINAFDAHNGWVNSKGHRENMLRNIKYLGAGVYFGGSYNVYYTQNMYE